MQQRMTASDVPMAMDDKAERKREEMAGKRLSTVASIMCMQLTKALVDAVSKAMSDTDDSRDGDY